MRSLIAVALLAGCTDTGAHLTLSAPQGPDNAESFEVVLVAPDPIPSVNSQRVAPADGSTLQTVSYFRQRTRAGDSTKIGDVDGFTVRIAPDESIPDTQFIPFVIMHDASGAITGIATYRDGNPLPGAILVMRDEIDKYKLTVERVTEPADDLAQLQAGQARRITCTHDDGRDYPSGIVWRPLEGGEYRILFPNDGGLDATGRDLDLDCDQYAVTAESSRPDCDDTRDWFHREADETCDGYDTNCDTLQTVVTTCDLDTPNLCNDPFAPGPGTGIQLCNESTQHTTDCRASATCACAGGTCRYCKVPFAYTNTQAIQPCQPAAGLLQYLPGCSTTSPCDLEIVGMRGGWKVELSAREQNLWSNRAYDVMGAVDIRAKRPEGDTFTQPGQPSMALADVDIAIITATTTTLLTLQLRLDSVNQTTCAAEPVLLCN